jgi:hypothetical protein
MLRKFSFFLVILITFFAVQGGVAQTDSYIFLDDPTGLGPSVAEKVELEEAAESLVAAFPTEYQSQFKVIDGSIYPILSYTLDGTEEAWQKLKVKSSQTSNYYLLVAKEHNFQGEVKWKLDLKLPESDEFECLDSSLLKFINGNLQGSLNEVEKVSELIGLILTLKSIIIKIVECDCSGLRSGEGCNLSSDDLIDGWLKKEGFVKIETSLKIAGEATLKQNGNNSRDEEIVYDFTNFEYNDASGFPVDIISKLDEFVVTNELLNSTPQIYLIKNENISDGTYSVIDSISKERLPSLTMILYVQKSSFNDTDIDLWLRIEGGIKEYFPLSLSPEEGFMGSGGGAKNFNELINVVREVESKLIGGGHTSIKERIEIIRGIFYGKTWSMDRSQSYGSDMRSNGFKTFLCNPTTPLDPRTLLGTTLFNKIKNSAEVIDGNNGVDFGHIIIGLEARLNFCSSKINIICHESTGLEISTWIGDLGGGSGILAQKRIANPSTRAKTIYANSNSDFGGWLNMEGDMAAYLVARDKSKSETVPTVSLTNDDYIADALKNYLIPQPPYVFDWSNRTKLFLGMIGGKFSGNNLANKSKLIEEVADDIEDFSENYMVLKVGMQNFDKLYVMSKNFEPCSKEIAQLFIEGLIQTSNNTMHHFSIGSFDPNPLPSAESYSKYKALINSKEIYAKMKSWLSN